MTGGENRIQNFSNVDECTWCWDTGQLCVGMRKPLPPMKPIPIPKHRPSQLLPPPTMHEEMGPCPYCERGFRLEFGIGVKRDSKGNITDFTATNPEGGPWGRLGFWKGRTPVGLVPEPSPHIPAKALADHAARAKALSAKIGAEIVE